MCGVQDDQIQMACNFLRDIGSLLIFDGLGLENLVILNPRWLTNVMSSLITFRHSWVKAGTLPLQDVPQVFKIYPIEMHETLLSLLEQFAIIFRIHSQGKREILVPSLLPEECAQNILLKEWRPRQKSQTDEYGRIYRFPFLPLGFFGRIMVRVLHIPGVKGNLFWRYGMVIEYDDKSSSIHHQTTLHPPSSSSSSTPQQQHNNFSNSPRSISSSKHLALLEYDPVQFRFSIRVRVPKIEFGKNMLLQTLVDCVDTILEDYCMRECAERLIPCTHCIDSDKSSSSFDGSNNSPFLFSYAECVIAVTEFSGCVFCNHIRSPSRMVYVDKLAPDISLSGIPLIDDKQLKILDILGKGGFGTVYKAEFQPVTNIGRYKPAASKRKTRLNRKTNVQKTNTTNTNLSLKTKTTTSKAALQEGSSNSTTLVAVKELICEDKLELALMYSDFQAEVYVMSQMKRHPNIVRLHGVCIFPKPRMVLELLPLGDLFGFIHPKASGSSGSSSSNENAENLLTYISPHKFPWKLRLLMALDIAKGMFVLHSQSPPIIHRDLRSPNIFLSSLDENSSVRAKVADFGLARIVAPTVSGTLNTWQWLAPEVIGVLDNQSKNYGISSDVYSFAIICWELTTCGFPFDEFNNDKRFTSSSNSKEASITKLKNSIATENLRPTLLPSVDKSKKPIEGKSMPKEFRELIEQCWKTDPSERPSFFDILDRLHEICSHFLNQKQKNALLLLKNSSENSKPERASCRLTIDFQPLQITNIFQDTIKNITYHTEYKKIQQFLIPTNTVSSSSSSSLLYLPSCVDLLDSLTSFNQQQQQQQQQQSPTVPPRQKNNNNNHGKQSPLGSLLSSKGFSNQQSSSFVTNNSFSPTLWVGSFSGSIFTWNLCDNGKINSQLIMTYDRPIQQIIVSSDLNSVWVCCLDGKMMIWDAKTSQLIREWNLRKNTIITMVSMFTNSGDQQIWVVSPHCIHVYSGGQLLHILNVAKKIEIRCVAQHMNVAWVGVGNEIYVYDIETLDLLGSWEAHSTPVNFILSVGDSFVWTSSNREICVWSVNNLEIFCSKKLEIDGICKTMYFSNIDNLVWTAVGDNVIIWDCVVSIEIYLFIYSFLIIFFLIHL